MKNNKKIGVLDMDGEIVIVRMLPKLKGMEKGLEWMRYAGGYVDEKRHVRDGRKERMTTTTGRMWMERERIGARDLSKTGGGRMWDEMWDADDGDME